jgi:hypothetical protein
VYVWARQKRPTIQAKETYYRGKRDPGIVFGVYLFHLPGSEIEREKDGRRERGGRGGQERDCT